MNYLAHIFLSGNNPKLQIGNFIGDFVKGSQYNNYPKSIRQGVLFHREIDDFTDNNRFVKETVSFLRPSFGRYSAIILDMYFDYFLAKNFRKFSSKSLHFFAYRFYFTTMLNYYYLPKRVKGFIFHFIYTNRLQKYASKAGLQNSLEIMAKYKVSAIQPDKCIAFLNEHEIYLEEKFHLFFKEMLDFIEIKNVSSAF